MMLTITDGKIHNIITSMSPAEVCYVHGVAPKQINHNVKLLQDMSTFHKRITFFEYLLHISCRIEIEK
jgi:hypothetical protein